MATPPRKGNEDLLLAWASLIADIAAPWAVPWAKPLTSGLKVLVEHAKKHPAWAPRLPAPPHSEPTSEQIVALEQALQETPPPQLDLEMLSELMGYHALWRLYPDLHAQWLMTTTAGVPLAPFIELWANRPDPGAPALPLGFELAVGAPEFRVPSLAQSLGNGVRDLVESKLKSDEPKLRIVSFWLERGEPRLGFTLCSYRDYLGTNWAIANLKASLSQQLREQLCGVGSLWPIEKSLCANDLGVSAVISFEDEIPIPVSNSDVISSPQMIVPSASGSADFLEAYWTGQMPGPAQDILREAGEELGLGVGDFRHARPRLLALTRNVLRGGKPEAFYSIHLPMRRPQRELGFELKRRATLRLPALLTADDRPVADFDARLHEVEAFTRRPSLPGDVMSPFTRVALHYYAQYARACRRLHRHQP